MKKFDKDPYKFYKDPSFWLEFAYIIVFNILGIITGVVLVKIIESILKTPIF